MSRVPTAPPSDPSDTDRSGSRDSVPSFSRREALSALGGTVAAGVAGCLQSLSGGGGTFKIGVAIALSQGWEAYGNTMLRAVRIAADDLNENGGLGGREVEVLVEDTQVSPQTTRDKVTKLITQNGADVIFGPISSTNRIAMAPLLTEHQVPALYAVEYEGSVAEDYCNEWLFKVGEIPPQQIDPFVPWLIDEYGSSFYLLGSDYVWPQKMNEVTTTVVEDNGGEVVEEQYVPIGETDFTSIIPQIESAAPDILFMTLTGPSVPAIQEQMSNFGVRGQWTDVGISHGQGLLAGAPAEAVEGVVSCHAYMENLDTQRNQEFVQAFRERGAQMPITFLTGPSYIAISLLEQAVDRGGGTGPAELRDGLRGVSAETIIGQVSIDVDQQATLPTTASRVNSERKHVPVRRFDAVQPPEHCEDI